jgi:hypothetical protein
MHPINEILVEYDFAAGRTIQIYQLNHKKHDNLTFIFF